MHRARFFSIVVLAAVFFAAAGCEPAPGPESDTTASRPREDAAAVPDRSERPADSSGQPEIKPAEAEDASGRSGEEAAGSPAEEELAAKEPLDSSGSVEEPAGGLLPLVPPARNPPGSNPPGSNPPESPADRLAQAEPAAPARTVDDPGADTERVKPEPAESPESTPSRSGSSDASQPADSGPPAQKGPSLVPPEQQVSRETEEIPLIPRKKLFGNPERAMARISPDGTQLSYLAPVDGVLNVWVAPLDDLDAAKPVTKDTDRGIRSYSWAYTSRHILYSQDNKGDEDFHVYAVDLESGDIKDLTPIKGIRAQIVNVSEKFPTEILVGINDRDQRQLHDVYRVNIETGERELVQLNPGFAAFLADDDYRVRLAVTFTPEGGQQILTPKEDAEGWESWLTISAEDAMTTSPVGFTKEGDHLYLLDSRERNTAALKKLDLESGDSELLAENERADISGVITHPTEKHVQAVTYTYARREWQILDESIADDLAYLEKVADGELQVVSRTLDDETWVVAYLMDDGPIRYYLYRRPEKKAEFLFSNNPELESLPLVKMHAEIIPARDGKQLVSYLTLPKGTDPDGKGRPRQALPMVLLVHGGPWARDEWGYNPLHQLLANRGYAVLSVNYRGSTGFGKEFINAADREWAAAMHDDLLDAVQWAVDQGIAKEDQVAIMGGSYGGYATLVGLTFTPEVFTCGVDIVGPSNLVTLLQNPPPYWMPFMPVMKRRVGDYETDEGRAFLESRSPLFKVDEIKRPLLIAQGKFDPRVKQAESDQIVEAMTKSDIPVTYMLFQEEGHGFAKPENRFAFYAVTEAFLAEHLGGRYEAIGDAFDGAKFDVPSGKDQVPGLEKALSTE